MSLRATINSLSQKVMDHLLISIFLAIAFIVGSGCSTNLESTDRPIEGTTPTQPGPGNGPDGPDGPAAPMIEGTRFLKTKAGPEIKATFEQLTGINAPNSPSISGLNNYFNENNGNLPTSDQASMVSDVNLVAIQNYADEFCWQLLGNSTARNQFFANTSFTQTGVIFRDSLLDTPDRRRQLVTFLVSKFWRPSASPQRENEISILNDLVEELYATSQAMMNSNTADQGKRIVSAICMATLAAPAVIFN